MYVSSIWDMDILDTHSQWASISISQVDLISQMDLPDERPFPRETFQRNMESHMQVARMQGFQTSGRRAYRITELDAALSLSSNAEPILHAEAERFAMFHGTNVPTAIISKASCHRHLSRPSRGVTPRHCENNY